MFSLGKCYYSTLKEASKLWVKHNGSLPTQVSLKGCINIDDFAKKVKQELNTNAQVGIFTSLDKEPIKPWLTIKDLLKTDDLKRNSGESPLFVKLIPTTQDSITSKTIYIRCIDEECKPLDSYSEVLIESDADVK